MPSTVEMINCVLFTRRPTYSIETEGTTTTGQDQKNLTNTILHEHRQLKKNCLILSQLAIWTTPKELSKYYQHYSIDLSETVGGQEACSWVKVQSLLTLPQGPVTLWLNPVGLLKSFWGWRNPAPGKLKRAMTSELHIWWPQASGFSCGRNNYTCSILPGEGDGTPLQYSCLENPMDRGAW